MEIEWKIYIHIYMYSESETIRAKLVDVGSAYEHSRILMCFVNLSIAFVLTESYRIVKICVVSFICIHSWYHHVRDRAYEWKRVRKRKQLESAPQKIGYKENSSFSVSSYSPNISAIPFANVYLYVTHQRTTRLIGGPPPPIQNFLKCNRTQSRTHRFIRNTYIPILNVHMHAHIHSK